jgi:hypothetical protein
MLARAAYKSINSYIKKNSTEGTNSPQAEGNTILGQLAKQKSEGSVEAGGNEEDPGAADDFKIYRKPEETVEQETMMVMQIDENERFDPRSNTWSSSNLLPSDPSKLVKLLFSPYSPSYFICFFSLDIDLLLVIRIFSLMYNL